MRPSNWQSFTFPTDGEVRSFISDIDSNDVELAKEMWNSSTSMRGLLTARPAGSVSRSLPKGEKDYTFDPATGVYRDPNGRAVSGDVLRRSVMRVSANARERLRNETRQLIAGTIMFVVWYERSRNILKALYATIWLLWLGGFLFDDQSWRDLFYIFVLMQFRRFEEFARQLDTGAQALDGTAVSRAGSYGWYGNAFYQNVKLQRGIAMGHDQARRVLGENENHCTDSAETPGCIELADLGWMPINHIVPLGGATCRANCLCQIETRKWSGK
jgi:hypothetical protein